MLLYLNRAKIKIVLSQLHAAHPGVLRMKRLLWAYVWWPELDEQIEEMVWQCPVCDSQQIKTLPATPILPIQWLSGPWAHAGSCWIGRTFSRSSIPSPNRCTYQIDGSEYIAICCFRVYHKSPERDICHIWSIPEVLAILTMTAISQVQSLRPYWSGTASTTRHWLHNIQLLMDWLRGRFKHSNKD